MVYQAYNKEMEIIETGTVKNKEELRRSIITSSKLHEFGTIVYGKKVYSMSDIYSI